MSTEQGPVEEMIHVLRIDKELFNRWMDEHKNTFAEEFGQNPDIYFVDDGTDVVIVEKPSEIRKASIIEAVKPLIEEPEA